MRSKDRRREGKGRETKWEAKEHGGCYREESEDEKERRKAEAF